MSSVTVYARQEGATVSYGPPVTGFVVPTKDESLRLMEIVRAAYPKLTIDSPLEFHRALIASGHMHRLKAPHTKLTYVFILDAANRLLAERFGLSTVSSNAFLGSCIAHCDVPYVFFDAIAGQMTGVGLDPYSGIKCNNGWQSLLQHGNLLPPTPPRQSPSSQTGQANFLRPFG
jgi:hypothetical protein